MNNPLQLNGIDFVEFSTQNPKTLERLFFDFGFSKVARHREMNIDVYVQGQITLLLNFQQRSFAADFGNKHGSSISAMGWRVKDAKRALALALERGARACSVGDYATAAGPVPAVFGIGNSLIYFTDRSAAEGEDFPLERYGFVRLQDPVIVASKGFFLIDHLTNNVYKGTMDLWAAFYKEVFGFEEVRHFDIRGKKTGLTSYALRSPCGKFCIPINEADEAKSQINEYLEAYHGPGIQHLAFLTDDLVRSVRQLQGSSIETLDIEPEYYKKAFVRVPNVKEDRAEIEKLNILVDGDEKGYLLQIFTKNLIGPIFIELIQRENHKSFGEGNFQALFDSIERDQVKRGVL